MDIVRRLSIDIDCGWITARW